MNDGGLHKVTYSALCRHHRSNKRMKQAVILLAEYFGNIQAYCELCREVRTVRTTAYYEQDGLFDGSETE